ncbi:protein kinase [Lentisphaera profundi]|uniref:Protein kinase n=1 Tax=Lentisphaera profundi TaxID=1658616 RepID=A0ABY7VW25_9BACT|nr:protein kinase [Lentisphaera profundi]WDE97031.1 protein kinase [Lentisphaera profundi]
MSENSSHIEEDKLHDALAGLYDLSSNEIEESNPESLPIYSSLSAEENRYQDERLLARGGVKLVYKAFDPKTGRYVALAKLDENAPEELFEPFLREARLSSLMEHPNIITIYDIGLDAFKKPYFTMELKTGKSLDLLITEEYEQDKNLSQESLRKLLTYYLRICDAVAYAHSMNVLHLDLKAENIQVGKYGEVIVCDWGLGRLVGSREYDGGDFDSLLLNPDLLNNMTLSGEIKGTPGYMSPEQVNKKKSIIDKYSDIYALGALLYTILCNQSPASDCSSLEQILEQTIKGDFPDPQTINKNIPRALQAVISKAMALEPSKRYGDVEELYSEIDSYLLGYSPTAENASLIKEFSLFYGRNKTSCKVSFIFIFLLMIFTSLSFKEIKEKESSTSQALILLEKEQQEKERIGREAAPAYFKKARELLNRGLLIEAYSTAETGYLLDPLDQENLNLMGLILFVQGKYESAQFYLDKPTVPLFNSLKKLNQLYLTNDYSEKDEIHQIKSLLDYCKWILDDEKTLTLFLYWAIDPRKEIRAAVKKHMIFHLEDCQRVLTYARRCKPEYAELLFQIVLDKLNKKQRWVSRRISARIGANWATREDQRISFKKLIPANLALGQKVVSSGGDEKEPEFMLDGNYDHYSNWAASPYPAYATIDLGGMYEVSRFEVYLRDNNTVYQYNIYTSNDGISFNKVIDQSQTQEKSRKEAFVHKIKATMARYVRLEVTYHHENIGVHIREFEVY